MRFLPLLWHILKITRVFLAGDLLFLCQQMRREIWTFLSSAHCHCLIWRSYQSTIASKLVNNISINTFWRLSTVLNPIFLFIPCKMQLSRFNVKCYVTSNCFWAREKINKLNLSSMYTFQCYRNRPRKRKKKKTSQIGSVQWIHTQKTAVTIERLRQIDNFRWNLFQVAHKKQ